MQAGVARLQSPTKKSFPFPPRCAGERFSALDGGTSPGDLTAALTQAQAHRGLSLVHVPVYFGPDPAGGMGAYGQWNVGNWCQAVQARYAETLI